MGDYNFSDTVVKTIAHQAMHICSDPHCLKFTGYTTSIGKARACAEGAHILPSSKKGPRNDQIKDYPGLDLSSAANGIWLCLECHDRIDNDPASYPAELLFSWKRKHEDVIRRIAGKDIEAALLELKSIKRYHEEAREFVAFMEGRRVLYEGFDAEFPPRVISSIETIRERVNQTKARISSDSSLFSYLNGIQAATNGFLKNIGKKTDLYELQCNCNDPVWVKFAEELESYRNSIVILLKFISADADYKLTWV
jgi:hypothetical protein